MNADAKPPPEPDPAGTSERKYDIITLALAGALAIIVLGAIGYGIVNSSNVTTAIPTAAPASRSVGPTVAPEPASAPATTGSSSSGR